MWPLTNSDMSKSQRTRIAAYALIIEDERILLCRISKELPRWQGCWTLPGGGIDFGEDPKNTVLREVLEETGLKIKLGQLAFVDSIADYAGEVDFHGIRIAYFASVVGGELKFEETGSTDRCEWHPINQLTNLPLVDLTQTAIEFLRGSRDSKNEYLR